ncbi:peptidylprolyl isomerase [Pseudodesulfovibrio sp.]|uniref:peptidylprolyl isomerase n=1 Tax=Pseudodesulfovibrio sp. TaxID=2035812 RepID=UPI002608E639|nr:peptidylprolyl isomerase [Pseudodesulfovibrio sp.]MDD3312100.1 peptidylprolyl isomerase [Pseudodesulfovibrio sp.]
MLKLRKILMLLALAGALLLGPGNAPSALAGAQPNPAVVIETSMGRIIVMLYPDVAPITVANFLRYVDSNFYNGTIFHRIVKMEVQELSKKDMQQSINIVQGGGYIYPLERKQPTWGPIRNEGGAGLLNERGTIAMARSSNPDSAQAEFFFNVQDNPGLNAIVVNRPDWEIAADPKGKENNVRSVRQGYCPFGRVIRGMDVVDKMLDVKTTRMGQFQDVPAQPIFIKRMYRAQ